MVNYPSDNDYKLAAGYNQAGSLALITAAGFQKPIAIGRYTAGARRVTASGTLFLAGYPQASWLFSIMTSTQFELLQSTYCSSGYSGLVTVRTRTTGLTFANYNAVLTLPDPSDLEVSPLSDDTDMIYQNVTVTFSKLDAL